MNAKDYIGMAAIHYAAPNSHANVIEYLAGQRADTDAQSNEKEPALCHTASKDHTEVVACLLQAEAKTKIEGLAKKTALYAAISGKHMKPPRSS